MELYLSSSDEDAVLGDGDDDFEEHDGWRGPRWAKGNWRGHSITNNHQRCEGRRDAWRKRTVVTTPARMRRNSNGATEITATDIKKIKELPIFILFFLSKRCRFIHGDGKWSEIEVTKPAERVRLFSHTFPSFSSLTQNYNVLRVKNRGWDFSPPKIAFNAIYKVFFQWPIKS